MAGFAYNGIHFVSWQRDEYLCDAAIAALDELADSNANWASLLVTWYQSNAYASTITPDLTRTPSDEAIRATIERMHDLGLKVMLKPHVDAIDGAWRGTFRPIDANAWFRDYACMLGHYAQLAESSHVEAVAIGTEFRSITGRPFRRRWIELISDVRTRFSGLLTYAANASDVKDEFTRVSFWDAVDFIGLDAYFPVADGWEKYVPVIQKLSHQYDKSLVFTEIGYRSVSGAAREPWNYASTGKHDAPHQAHCYQAFFDAWRPHRRWMQGAFWWNWPAVEADFSGTDYSPRAKLACQVLSRSFEITPEMARARQVAEIRRRVQSGNYEIDPQAISRSIIGHSLRSREPKD